MFHGIAGSGGVGAGKIITKYIFKQFIWTTESSTIAF